MLALTKEAWPRLVPIKKAEATLSGLWCLGNFTTTRAAVYLDFVGVGRQDSLRGPLYKAFRAVSCKLQHVGIVRK